MTVELVHPDSGTEDKRDEGLELNAACAINIGTILKTLILL